MSDFNPVTLFHITSESFGIWLWVVLAAGLLLIAGVVTGFARLRRAGRSPRRPLTAALIVLAVATTVFTLLMPRWTLAGLDAMAAPVDWFIAILLALVPASLMSMAAFSVASRKCASRGAKAVSAAA